MNTTKYGEYLFIVYSYEEYETAIKHLKSLQYHLLSPKTYVFERPQYIYTNAGGLIMTSPSATPLNIKATYKTLPQLEKAVVKFLADVNTKVGIDAEQIEFDDPKLALRLYSLDKIVECKSVIGTWQNIINFSMEQIMFDIKQFRVHGDISELW